MVSFLLRAIFFRVIILVYPIIFKTIVWREVFLEWSWFKIIGVNFSLVFLVDWIRTLFFFSVMLISGAVILYRTTYISVRSEYNKFILLVILFVISIGLLIFSLNLFRLILGWDGLGVTSFLLVNFYSSEKRYNAAIITTITNRLGDVFIIISIGLIWPLIRVNFRILRITNLELLGLTILILARITKRAQIPFSSWLPAAMAAPTPVSSLVHSSTLVTAGIYLIIRFNYLFIQVNLLRFILLVGLITMVIARVSAVNEVDFKKIVALSTLRNLGVIIFSLGIGEVILSYLHLLGHAYFKAMLFIRAGIFIHSSNDYQDSRIIGSELNNPVNSSVFICGVLRGIGLIFFTGFFTKDRIVEMLINSEFNLMVIIFLLIGILSTFTYSFRMAVELFINSINFSPISNSIDLENYSFVRIVILLPLCLIGGYRLILIPFNNLSLEFPYFLKVLLNLILLVIFIFFLSLSPNVKFLSKYNLGFNFILFMPITFRPMITNLSLNFSNTTLKNIDRSWIIFFWGGWLTNLSSTSYFWKQLFNNIITVFLMVLFLLIVLI